MRADPRGPLRTAVAVDPQPGATLVTLSCGHVAHFAQHFHYEVGDEHRCHACGRMKPRVFIPCSGESSDGELDWAIRRTDGPAWWRATSGNGRTRRFGSREAAEWAALRMEKRS